MRVFSTPKAFGCSAQAQPPACPNDSKHKPCASIETRTAYRLLRLSSWPAATTMYIGEMGREVKRPIILQGTMAAPKEGHMRLPDQFYQGLHFGLSAWDEWGEKVSMRSVFQAVR